MPADCPAELMATFGEKSKLGCPGSGGDISLIGPVTEPGQVKRSSSVTRLWNFCWPFYPSPRNNSPAVRRPRQRYAHRKSFGEERFFNALGKACAHTMHAVSGNGTNVLLPKLNDLQPAAVAEKYTYRKTFV